LTWFIEVVYTFYTFQEKIMTRTIFALVAALFASSLFAEEEIYLYTSYNNNEGTRVSHMMKCRDSLCEIKNNAAEPAISLSNTQRDQILEAFQAEVKRFDIKSTPKSSDRLIKIKFRYLTDRKRLEITQRLPVEQLSDVSPELTAVIETYLLGLDLSSLGSPEPATSNEESVAPVK
jgi:hypothetical protein